MSEETKQTTPRRVLSGMRPTGKLHLGNYMGALKNWVELQNATNEDGAPKYECYFFIADFHALTTDYADTSELPANVKDVLLDFLAAGLDTKRSTIFLQSEVPAHAELSLLLGMITPLSWLERVPTYKDQQEQLKEKDLATYGFLGYPVMMSADILVYQTDFVPVGLDQAAHVEITREIARRFNFLYPTNRDQYSPSKIVKHDSSGKILLFEIPSPKTPTDSTPVFAIQFDQSGVVRKEVDNPKQSIDVVGVLTEPKVLLTPSPKLPGTDGRKMSKSYGNTILLSDAEADVRAKLKTMVTDPARVRRTDVGNPDVCPVFDLHKVFSTVETQQNVRVGCTTAGIGCIQCKGWLADAVVKELAPIQERRRYFEAHPDEANAILDEGAVRANARAEQTMREVRTAMRLARR
jgi:tryptophanyl-tRNA synthetase